MAVSDECKLKFLELKAKRNFRFIVFKIDERIQQMLYASSKDRFKRELDGIQVELQATDPSEMSIDIVKGRAL
ncbi:hypothetical protein C4D60_Mb08t10690 [Musa balbisiana]|uniref:ADF-H domain-containing protein n=2 Tax=Musa TaxID=4640 RepID=A0A4S8K2X0_MUSBA|nr:hypothetical protein C4D60_Mb08t10690 [Musa balbisiana]URE33930.1 actin-depolymerizing factor [Musa troglodytarum]